MHEYKVISLRVREPSQYTSMPFWHRNKVKCLIISSTSYFGNIVSFDYRILALTLERLMIRIQMYLHFQRRTGTVAK